MPALEQNISMPPESSLASLITLIISCSFETSAATARPPIVSAVSLAPSIFISTQTIDLAPASLNAIQRALPMPLAAPVTTILLFKISIILFYLIIDKYIVS